MIVAILATNLPEFNRYVLMNVKEIDVIAHDIQTQSEALDYLSSTTEANVVVLSDLLRGDMALGDFIEKVIQDKPVDTKVFYMASEYTEDMARMLAKHKVNCFVKGTRTLDEFIAQILSECRLSAKANVLIKTKHIREVEYRSEIKSVFKEVIAVYSPLSQGSSTVAAHLAVALACADNYKVCLVDFNPLKPKVRDLFHLKLEEHTLSDVLSTLEKGSLTAEAMEAFTKQSRYKKNLDLLSGLYNINDYYTSKVEQYEEIIEKLKFIYDYVVVDTHAWYDVLPTDAALRKADKIVVPVQGNRYSISEVLRYFGMFSKYNDFDLRKFHIVINKYGGKDFTSVEIASKLKYPILGYVGFDAKFHWGNCFSNRKQMKHFTGIVRAMDIPVRARKALFAARGRKNPMIEEGEAF